MFRGSMNEALGMPLVRGFEHALPAREDDPRPAEVDIGRGEHREAAVAVVVVVPGEKGDPSRLWWKKRRMA